MKNIEPDGLFHYITNVEREMVEVQLRNAFDEIRSVVTEVWESLDNFETVLRYIFRGHR